MCTVKRFFKSTVMFLSTWREGTAEMLDGRALLCVGGDGVLQNRWLFYSFFWELIGDEFIFNLFQIVRESSELRVFVEREFHFEF